jgi:glycosyltransferase involved in cell wall biosynthesis
MVTACCFQLLWGKVYSFYPAKYVFLALVLLFEVVSAFATVHRQLPDARLVLVGDGELRPALVEQVDKAGLEGSVEFVGVVDNVWPYLHDADVFALASRSETFGMVVVEAMAAGLPVVAPPVGGIPELVTPGLNGELFPPGDCDALAAKILRLLRSPELRTRMGAAARRSARAFRMETTVQRYFELYGGLVGAPAPTASLESSGVSGCRSLGVRKTNS